METDPIPSVEPVEPTEQQAPDYESMTVEQLEAEFDRTGGMVEESVTDVTPTPEPEPEPEQATEPDEIAADSEEVAEEAPVEDPIIDDRDLEFKEMSLKMEKLQIERDHERFVASNNAGKIGYLQQQLQQLSAEPRPRAAEYDDLGNEEAESRRVQPQQQYRPQIEDKVAELQSEQTNIAVKGVYDNFLAQVSSDLTKQGLESEKVQAEQNAIIDRIAPTLKDRFETFGSLEDMGTKTISKITGMVLQSAYNDVKLERLAALRKETSERKASQVSEARKVKLAASPPSAGSSGTPDRQKSPEEMTASEADAAMISLYGDGSRRRQRR